MSRKIFLRCKECNKERAVDRYYAEKPTFTNLCISCARKARRADKNPYWKGGKYQNAQGYTLVLLQPNDFFYKMASVRGYVMEHRLVMAKHIGRNLQPWEVVHHKRGIAKSDNKIEGLRLMTDNRHKQITILENRITFLEKENTKLRRLSVLPIKIESKED